MNFLSLKTRVLHNLSTSSENAINYDISCFPLRSIYFYLISIDCQSPATSESHLNGLIHNEKSIRWLTYSRDEWHRCQESWWDMMDVK